MTRKSKLSVLDELRGAQETLDSTRLELLDARRDRDAWRKRYEELVTNSRLAERERELAMVTRQRDNLEQTLREERERSLRGLLKALGV